MATIAEIDAQKDAAVAIQDQKVFDAIGLKNNGVAGMDRIIHTLMEQRQALFLAAFNAALAGAELASALAAMQAATTEMNTVATRMVSATQFDTNLAAFGTAANKVVVALTGGG